MEDERQNETDNDGLAGMVDRSTRLAEHLMQRLYQWKDGPCTWEDLSEALVALTLVSGRIIAAMCVIAEHAGKGDEVEQETVQLFGELVQDLARAERLRLAQAVTGSHGEATVPN